MMDLNKHIVKNDDNKPFHTSGYAQVAVGNRVGSAGNDTFRQRQQIDRNRQIIAGYNRSAIGSSYGALRAKSVADNLGNKSIKSSLQHPTTGLKQPTNPPPKPYNPYA